MDDTTANKPPVPNSNGATKKNQVGFDLEIRSEEVQEIIGRPPHWLVRWGIASFFGVLVLIFLAASTIKYPEVINAPLKLTAINAPKAVESRINGKIIQLLYENNSPVKEGDILGWMESTANHQSVTELSSLIDSLNLWLMNNEFQKIEETGSLNFNGLGSLQTNFQAFEQAYREFLSFLPGGYFSTRKLMLEEELVYSQELLNRLRTQKEIQQITYRLAEQEYEAQKQLAEKGVIASLELAKAESNFANERLPLQQTESAIINNRISQSSKKKEIMELDRQIAEQQAIFSQALYILKSVVDEWKSNYLLVAPIDGILLYAGIFQEKQTVATGQEILFIQPKTSEFFGEMTISQSSFGKIEQGQQVLVRFNGYPYNEFGSVKGEVEYFSDFPVRDSLFFAKVHFPEGLNTNYGHQLTPKNGMTGSAEIITQDMRLIERVYNNLTKELK